MLDERDLPDLISHILQALLLQLAHEALHGLHLGEEEVLIDPVQLALHAEADKRGDMRVRFGHQDVLTADHATLAEASDLMHPVLLGSRLSVHVLAFRSQFARGSVLLFQHLAWVQSLRLPVHVYAHLACKQALLDYVDILLRIVLVEDCRALDVFGDLEGLAQVLQFLF